jgi:uncharacterized protein (DUF1778 family)
MNPRIEPTGEQQIRPAAVSVAAARILAHQVLFALDTAAWERFCELLGRPARDLPGLDSADDAWQSHFAGGRGAQ